MPTYEYQCKSCSHRFEVWQKMSEEPLTVCPECQGAIRRILFPAGIVFKGSGFYKTDHASNRGSDEAGQKSASGEEKEVAAKAEGGSDKKDNNGGESKAGGSEGKATTKQEKKTNSSESKTSVAAD